VTKRAHYERVGVPEYWFVDLEADRVEACRLAGGRYRPPDIVERGGVLEPAHLPGLTVEVDDILAEPRGA
jgi:Uma2 family endonuclease